MLVFIFFRYINNNLKSSLIAVTFKYYYYYNIPTSTYLLDSLQIYRVYYNVIIQFPCPSVRLAWFICSTNFNKSISFPYYICSILKKARHNTKISVANFSIQYELSCIFCILVYYIEDIQVVSSSIYYCYCFIVCLPLVPDSHLARV